MVDVDSSVVYEVLPSDVPYWNKLSKQPSSTSRFTAPYSTYAVPRGVNGTPPTSRAIPPAVPPRNKNSSESDVHTSGGSLGNSPNERGGSLPSRGKSIPAPPAFTKSPSISSIEELSLEVFMGKYSKSLPHRVKVCKGFYGVSDQTAVTTGDVLNMHFLKSTKVVVIETGPQQGSTTYSVPLTSAIQFSPLYDPYDNIEEAKKGFKFNTVGDILSLKSYPKIVRATRSYQGGNVDNSVSENELLLIKGARNKLTGKQLKVQSLTSNKKKSLNENCAGHFTTAADKLCMYLYEITINLSDAFPCKALVTLSNYSHCVLNDLHGCVVTLKKSITETSVIATSALDEDDGENPEVAEMPVNLDIEVEAVPLEEHEREQLRTDTSYMYDNFDPFSVCLYMTKSTKRMYDIQCMLYTKLMNGGDFRGLEIIRPNAITNTPKRPSSPPTSLPLSTTPTRSTSSQSLNSAPTKKTSSSASAEYYVIMSPGAKQAAKRLASQDELSDQSGDSVVSHREHLEIQNRQLEATVLKNSEQIKKLNVLVEHLSRRCESLANQLRLYPYGGGVTEHGSRGSSCSESSPISVDRRPPAPLPAIATDPVIGAYELIGGSMDGFTPPEGVYSSPKDDESGMSHKEYLLTLNYQQVLNLLEMMGLQQYQDKFKAEQVNGDILSECDDDVLMNDLGVTSKLHRMKLLKIVSGHYSARKILNGENPYSKTKS